MSDNILSFHVSGFNYIGAIIIIAVGIDNDTTLIFSSTVGYIGSTNTAIDAIKLLDNYIEANEESYSNLFESFRDPHGPCL